jgi:hypothetical protein
MLKRCQFSIMTVLKLQPEDGFMKAETCRCCVPLINHILCNKVVLGYKIIYSYESLQTQHGCLTCKQTTGVATSAVPRLCSFISKPTFDVAIVS